MGCSQSTFAKKDGAKRGDISRSSAHIPSEELFALKHTEEKLEEKILPPNEPQTLESLASPGLISDKYLVSSKVLGSGQFAVVKLCKNRESEQKCAVKIINLYKTSRARLTLEVDILRRIKGHPNIVGLYDVYVSNTQVQLVMECVEGGELFDHLVSQGPYSEAEAVYHMRRIVSAVEFLHRNNIVHRDLKPENLLLTSRNPKYAEVKVADFGLARLCSEESMQTVCGTWAYCAPEVRNDPHGYGAKVDVWSLGVILYVLLVAFHPFDPSASASEEELWENAEGGVYSFDDPAWKSVSKGAQDVISKMIVVNSDNRLSAADVLAHPWLTGSSHPVAPLSPRINLDLKEVRSRYRQKVAGAGKAAWAAMAFQATAKGMRSRDELDSTPLIEQSAEVRNQPESDMEEESKEIELILPNRPKKGKDGAHESSTSVEEIEVNIVAAT